MEFMNLESTLQSLAIVISHECTLSHKLSPPANSRRMKSIGQFTWDQRNYKNSTHLAFLIKLLNGIRQ